MDALQMIKEKNKFVAVDIVKIKVGQILAQNFGPINSRIPSITADTVLTQELINSIQEKVTKFPDNYESSIYIRTEQVRKTSTSIDDKNKIIKTFSENANLNEINTSKKIAAISSGAIEFVNSIDFSAGVLKFNYIDYGNIAPDSHDRTIQALEFITALGTCYNANMPVTAQIDLKTMAVVTMLSTVGEMYDTKKYKDEKLANFDLRKLATVFQGDKDKENLFNLLKSNYPNLNLNMLDSYESKYSNLYSYCLLKKVAEKVVDGNVLTTILKVKENFGEVTGPLGHKFKNTENSLKSNMMAQIIKMGFTYQDMLIELNSNMENKKNGTEEKKETVNNISDFYQSLKQLALNDVNPLFVKMMINAAPLYTTGDIIKLSDGRIVTVLKLNDHNLDRPIVGYKEDGQVKIIDLDESNLSVTIEGISSYDYAFGDDANSIKDVNDSLEDILNDYRQKLSEENKQK